jgi:hypothetical protein
MNKRTLVTLILLVGGMFGIQQLRVAHWAHAAAKPAASAKSKAQHADPFVKPDISVVDTPLVHASFRPLNFALLRGGFSSVDEFFERVHDDPVLHAFYGDCSDRNASMHALPENITAFSTFRKGDKILWSRKPLLIKQGEYVMTFCGKSVLARCGNLISVVPMTPSEDIAPAVLEAPAEVPDAPLVLVASAAAPAPVPVVPVAAAAVPTVTAASHGFFFVPPFYVPPGGSHGGPTPTPTVPPPTTVVPPPTTITPPPVTPPPPVTTGPPPPITTAPPPPPSAPPAPPSGHLSGDEFSDHQALITLFIGLFVIALLKLTNR